MSKAYKPETKYQATSLIAVVLLLMIIFVSVGFFFFLAKPEELALRTAMTESFEAAAARWRERRPPAYRYVVDRYCDCPPEVDRAYVVTVDGSGRRAEFPIPVESSAGLLLDSPPSPVWLSSLMSEIEQTLRDDRPVEVRDNYLFGYPEFVDLAPGAGKPGTVTRFEIRDFEVLRGHEDSPD